MKTINLKNVGSGLMVGIFTLLIVIAIMTSGCSNGAYTPTGNTGYTEDAKDRYFHKRNEPDYQKPPTI